MKQINVTLIYGLEAAARPYRVGTVTDTTAIHPGQWLSTDYVQALCKDPDWHVTVVDDDFWKTLLMAVLAHIDLPTPKL